MNGRWADRWWRGARVVVAATIGIALLAGPAGAWSPPTVVSNGFQRGLLDDTDNVVATGAAVHTLMYVEDYADLEIHVAYSTSRVGSTVSGRVLDAKCNAAEGIAADGENVVALCSRESLWDIRIRQLLLYRIQGGSWGAPIQVQGSSRPADGSGSVAISGDLVVVAWTDARNGRIMFRRSTDGGRTFKPATALGGSTIRGTKYEGKPRNGRVQVAIHGSQVYAAWFPGSAKTARGMRPRGIRFRRSADGGQSFAAAQDLSKATQWPTAPSMVATDTGVLLLHATLDGRVRLLRSTNAGRTFGATALAGRKGMDDRLDIAASGQEVRAIWRQKTRVLLRRSADGGATWSDIEATSVRRYKGVEIRANVVLYQGATVVAWSDADPIWGDLGGAWVSLTSSP